MLSGKPGTLRMSEATLSTASNPSIELATDIVSAYVSNNPLPQADLPVLLKSIYGALETLSTGPVAAPEAPKLTSAQIRKSITPDALISFIDGKPYKTLKRHLSGNGLTIEEYRERYGLPRDYPTTAANYSAQRSALAKSLGLGKGFGRGGAAAKQAEPAKQETKKAAAPKASTRGTKTGRAKGGKAEARASA
jgi:predicted transcriptional regulator